MIVGIPKEIKEEEFRTALTPAGARELSLSGIRVLVEMGSGLGSGFADTEYEDAGAEIESREQVFATADLIVKVKEPLPAEYDFLRKEQTLFTYLHLAPNPQLTEFLMERRLICLAYETLSKDGRLPLLAPMSEVAGRMAPLMGAYYLQKSVGGTGVLPSGAVGTPPARALILGAGVVGTNAARFALGLGMDSCVMNIYDGNMQKIDLMFQGHVKTLALNRHNLEEELRNADVVIGAIYARGERTPILIPRELLSGMKRGAVIVDVAIDQGGCVASSHPTTHADPVFEEEGVLHYCVANMPGAFPRTSTLALTNATLPYIKLIATRGVDAALQESEVLRTALNVRDGAIQLPSLRSEYLESQK